VLDFANADNLEMAWDGDRHLLLGWPSGTPPAQGPERVRDIAVTYTDYEPDLAKERPLGSHEIRLQDPAFNFREEEDPQRSGRRCVVQVAGTDGTFFDRVVAEVIGIGTGAPQDRTVGTVQVHFVLTRSPEARSPGLTLTQAEFGSVFPANMRRSAPRQGNLSLRYFLYNYDEAQELFAHMRSGNLRLSFGLSFGREHLIYTATEAVPQAALESFNRCAEKTNIYGRAFAVPYNQ
jgi:hypothetical protein